HKKFQQINEANEVLGDPEKRKKYDQYGKDWKHAEQFEQARQSQQRSADSWEGTFSGGGFEEGAFSDFFESLFGGGGRRGRSRQTKFRGQDIQGQFQINLTEAYTTHQQTFTVNGENIRITIPAGIENGQKIKIAGHGEPGINGGPNGDLYITFSIINNTQFKRSGNDLYTAADIDLYTALLGGEITIDTLGGKVKLKVNPEIQNGTKVRLKGKGFPVYKNEGQFGDLFVTYHVKLPTNLTDKQKELIRQLSKM
ncbi:MAG TPA: DnaJ C-terminal domain-containing protein, partial [Chitinophagaceae bacterium]|nr:DnaJ C-terminal domain-containing protein [Chitinophagaceae bacterium]